MRNKIMGREEIRWIEREVPINERKRERLRDFEEGENFQSSIYKTPTRHPTPFACTPKPSPALIPSSYISMVAPNMYNAYPRGTMAVKANNSHLRTYNRSEDMTTNFALTTNEGSRKRPREVLCEINSCVNQEMLETYQTVLQCIEKFRIEMSELLRQKINNIYMVTRSEISKKLKMKDEERDIIVQTNRFLEEKIHNLAMESQHWQNIAQLNHATADILRADLHNALANKREEKTDQHIPDAESYCSGGEKEEQKGFRTIFCGHCREKDASVVLLPCQHLCLCNSCEVDPKVVMCPSCGANRTGAVNVNFHYN
ncbi:putative BOI-related E3 ubiquitin-protein ligase 3 [Carex littledalei]|uniref:Putative BOI-related E3 ubiquitin-protein ligase 3 n=1 Tax=Carex littledalei TaxID=544730 RepID=A0A833RDS4_9POAL|nr:putative BOI-related E3 ubiquitin-protein ligase 3 [Carex littledalei]